VKCDIAIVPVGGTYTMDAKKAAELVNTLARMWQYRCITVQW